MDPICHLNGRFLRLSEASVSPMDSGYLYGDGVYDTLRVYNRHIHLLPDHLRRLSMHLKTLQISFRGVPRLPGIFASLIRRNGFANGVLRVQITRGLQLAPPPNPRFGRSGIFVTLRPFEGYPEKLYGKGVAIRIEASPSVVLHSKPKSTSFQNNLLARPRATRASHFETVFEHEGNLLEGSMTNIFLVRGHSIHTPPPEGILSGVTRAAVLRLAAGLGFQVREKPCTVRQALESDEIFLTGTTLEIMPVRRLTASSRRRSFRAFPVATLLRIAYRLGTSP